MHARLFAATAATLLIASIASPAYARHCPKDAAAIDHALGVMSVPEDVKAEVTALRDKGMAEHAAGNHDDAEKSLVEAMRKLLMSAN